MSGPLNWNSVPNLTPGMKNLGNQFNKRWPNRDGTSDGAKGDTAHQSSTSSHNPDDTPGSKPEWEDADSTPDIRGIDVDNNLNESGTDMTDVCVHLQHLPNLASVVRYYIYNRQEYHCDNNFSPVPYTGSSPHTEHIHFSGARTESADQNTTFDFKFEEVGDFVDKPTFFQWMDEYFNRYTVDETNSKWRYTKVGNAILNNHYVPNPLNGPNEKSPLYDLIRDTAQNILTDDAVADEILTTVKDTEQAIEDHVSGIIEGESK